MSKSIILAIEFYVTAFVVALFIAGLIKGMLAVIRRISLTKQKITKESEGEI